MIHTHTCETPTLTTRDDTETRDQPYSLPAGHPVR